MKFYSARTIVLAFAIVNAALYACFLPLWEGFDEPFHYAYVESLSANHTFPVFGHSKVSAEIDSSLGDVPVSRFLSPATPGTPTFEQWFTLPAADKEARAVRPINTALRTEASALNNYEAQQSPLAYVLLAPFDAALSHVDLRLRVLVLRLISAVAATLLLSFGLSKLCTLLRVSDVFAPAAMACIFGSQMLWATVAHIGNDSLAVPLTLLFLTCLGLAVHSNRASDLLILSALLAAGLLTKAYFLAFAPVFGAFLGYWILRNRNYKAALIAVLIPLITAGPWYWHNHQLYGSFSGTQQAVAGIGFTQALQASTKIPWLTSAADFLRWSLWTGNWSFLSFSKATLNAELILAGVALAFYLARFRRITAPEWWCLAACACFVTALIYQTCVTYVHTHGESLFAEPWYWQGVVCFIWVIAFRGLLQGGIAGRVLAIATVVLSAWIAAITYVGKLFPMYGGGFEPATFHRVWAWWTAHPTLDLKLVALAPPPVLYALLLMLLALIAVQTAAISTRLLKMPPVKA